MFGVIGLCLLALPSFNVHLPRLGSSLVNLAEDTQIVEEGGTVPPWAQNLGTPENNATLG